VEPDLALRARADREKRLVALSSVLAAIFLTGMKIVVGLLTGSLGILAEAAHSALDLVAAAVTLFAVRVSGRPADMEHNYGHGKIENLSALFETVLLLVTCAWIIYEAIQRLFFEPVEVQVNIWAFVVMGVSIIIDVSRSRALARIARRWDSQALEADALHFSTDVWSSSVVIAGLTLVWLSQRLGIPQLAQADAIAAIGVAGIVVYVSLQLGKRTIEGLLDAVPSGLRDELESKAKVPGVTEVRQVRVRRSGPEAFVDVTLAVGRDLTLEQAHEVASTAEASVRKALPGADVVVHVDPVQRKDEESLSTIRLLAAAHGVSAHSVRMYDIKGQRTVELHLEVSPDLSLEAAHAQATELERAIYDALQIDRVLTHIEPVDAATPPRRADSSDEARVRDVLAEVCREMDTDLHPHELKVQREDGQISVSFHCRLDPDTSIAAAHAASEEAEQLMRRRLPDLGRVMIHVEPANEAET
jgi:cation diffusion facilitator family transporter